MAKVKIIVWICEIVLIIINSAWGSKWRKFNAENFEGLRYDLQRKIINLKEIRNTLIILLCTIIIQDILR